MQVVMQCVHRFDMAKRKQDPEVEFNSVWLLLLGMKRCTCYPSGFPPRVCLVSFLDIMMYGTVIDSALFGHGLVSAI